MGKAINDEISKETIAYVYRIASQCKECLRGNESQCLHTDCLCYRARQLKYLIKIDEENRKKIGTVNGVQVSKGFEVEGKIIDILKKLSRWTPVKEIQPSRGYSRYSKTKRIRKMIQNGLLAVRWINGQKFLGLPEWEETEKKKQENENAK